MSSSVLNASLRSNEQAGSAQSGRFRKQGLIPGVAYRKGVENVHFLLQPTDLTKILDTNGRNALIELTLDNGSTHTVMLQEFQRHPLTRKPLHVDLRIVKKDEKIKAKVNVDYVGTAHGVKMGGRLNIARRYVYLECLPQDVPTSVVVDISPLVGGTTLYTKDITIPATTKMLDHHRVAVLSIRGGMEPK